MRFREVIFFIPGILYSTERDVLYDTIEEIHELYILFRVFGDDDDDDDEGHDGVYRGHDALLDPCIETKLDDKVLESLVSQMRKTSLKDQVTFQEPKSLYVLPSLLPKLRPKRIKLDFSSSIPRRNIPHLIQTLKSAANNNFGTAVELLMYLSDWAQLPGQEKDEEEEDQVLPPVDKLQLDIKDDGSEDLEILRRLRLFSLATPPKELLRFVYYMRSAPRAAQVLNRTLFPTTREEEGGGGTTHLWVRLDKGSPADITLLLRSLTVPSAPPLRRIGIRLPGGPKIGDDDVEEWKQLCKTKE
ncbi:uncharacterized protein LOC135204459 [Macrobrachium nipponense]|uniref:uncharacterized protein LOC135204459 n=1 Tax=Macrobrachium nipponense TaxID=159736 RepID=UPI0030C8C7B0